MNCVGVWETIAKGYSATTVAERNAACVHCRTCEDCQRKILQILSETPVEDCTDEILAASLALAKDRSDPEWK